MRTKVIFEIPGHSQYHYSTLFDQGRSSLQQHKGHFQGTLELSDKKDLSF